MYQYFIIKWQLYYFSVFLEQKINNQKQTKICLTISIYSKHNLLHFKTIWNIYKKNCSCKKYVNINHKYFSKLNTPRKKYLCTQHFTLVYQRRGINSPLVSLLSNCRGDFIYLAPTPLSIYSHCCVLCCCFFIGGPHTTEFHLEPHWRKWEQILVCVCELWLYWWVYVCVWLQLWKQNFHS